MRDKYFDCCTHKKARHMPGFSFVAARVDAPYVDVVAFPA
jgi:hypothetical protein